MMFRPVEQCILQCTCRTLGKGFHHLPDSCFYCLQASRPHVHASIQLSMAGSTNTWCMSWTMTACLACRVDLLTHSVSAKLSCTVCYITGSGRVPGVDIHSS